MKPVNLFQQLDPIIAKNLLILFFAGLFFWTSLSSLLPIIPLYVKQLGGTTQEIGVVMGSFAIGLLSVRAWIGQLSDRQGRKIALIIGTFVVGVAPLGYLFSDSLLFVILTRIFHGVSVAGFTTGYSALVVDLSPPQQRGQLLGYMTLCTPLGVSIGPMMAGFLQQDFSYRVVFITTAVIGVGAFLLTLKVSENPPDADSFTDKNKTFYPESRSFQELLKTPSLFIPALVFVLVGTVFGLLVAFFPLYIQAEFSQFNPGLFYTATAIGSFGVRVFIGEASDRYGRGVFMMIGLLFYGLFLQALVMASSESMVLVAGVLEGMGIGILLPTVLALASDRSTLYERGKVFAIAIGGFDLGGAIAGPIFGLFGDVLSFRELFGYGIICIVIAMAIFMSFSNKTVGRSIRFAFGRGKDDYAYDLVSTRD